MKQSLLCVLVLVTVLLRAQTQEQDNRLLNQFIVMLAPGHQVGELMETYKEIAGVMPLSKRMNIWLVERNTTDKAEEFLKALNLNRAVLMAQFDHTFEERNTVPTDDNFNQQWNMMNTGQQSGVVEADIDATEAWDINHSNLTVNGDTLVVAVIDGKPYLAHEDLNFFTNYNEIPGNSIDDDGNGYVDDINGWNVVDTSGNVSGASSHGTHIAGIIGAKANNTVGIAGVCWGAKILPVIYGSTIESRVVAAYDYAREMRIMYNNTAGAKGAFVVSTNSSFGVDGANPANYPIWCAMYDSMGAVGILSAGATANKAWDIDIKSDVPTACSSQWLVTVTNTTRNDRLNGGAGYGKNTIDIGAPGTDVYSTVNNNSYSGMTGTSMSTPHVAGAIAAMYAAACKGLIDLYYEKPDSVALMIKEYLLDGAEWISDMNHVTTTGGRLNLYRAFKNLERFDCDSCGFTVAIDKVDISCHNASDGAMAATISGNVSDYTFMWSTGNTSPECLSMDPGFYTVQVADTNGCRRVWSEDLHNPDSISITNVNIIAAVGATPGSATVYAYAGNDSLSYSLDGTTYQASKTLSVATNGNYTVYVRNANGCIAQKSILVSGIEEAGVSAFSLQLYPNPARDEISIYSAGLSSEKITVMVYDAVGNIVASFIPVTDKTTFSVAEWQAGLYFVKAGNAVQKFSVIR